MRRKQAGTDMAKSAKDRSGAAVRIPPPITGILTIVAGYVIGRFMPLLTAYELGTPGRYWIGASVILSANFVLGIWPLRQFGKIEQDPRPWTATPEIIVHGPYRFSRNPMYLMLLFVCVGFAVIFSEIWMVILIPVLAIMLYHTAIKHEEAYLEEQFGESYLAYKNSVRRWL
jgi:protein-S-isoprenylcysteine O-methyltransferase Ste14